MSKIQVLKNQKGFSIAEVLIAFGLMSILGIVTVQIMQDSFNATSLAEAKNEELEMIRNLQMTLIYKPNCDKNMQGKPINDINAHDIVDFLDSAGKDIYKRDQVIGNRSLKILDIEYGVSKASLDSFNAFKTSAPAGETTYLMDAYVRVTTEKLKTAMGGKTLTKDIPIKVKVDKTSSQVVECFTTAEGESETAMTSFCAQLGGTYNATSKGCDFDSVVCDTTDPNKLVPAKCIDAKVAKGLEEYSIALDKKLKELEARMIASAPAPTPVVVAAATPTPTPDPYALPFSPTKPGKGCKGTYCAASDYGPCEGIGCTTNGGSCTMSSCRTGVVTGVVKWDGKNMYTPSNPGPGCTGTYCHASDYGPCNGIGCTTNGGSCEGSSCRTGVNE